MQLVLDARILSLKISHCKKRLENSRFIKISFEPFQDLYFDLHNGDTMLDKAIFVDTLISKENKNAVAAVDTLGGIFSIIGSAEEFSKGYVENNMLRGKFHVSILGSRLEDTFQTVPINDLTMDLISKNNAAIEKWKYFQHIRDLQVQEIFGNKQIQLELYTNLSQTSLLAVGYIDILLSIISVERQLKRCEDATVCCNILPTTKDMATCTTDTTR